jgi:MarR family transcriptional regulator, 2-MHQ and catechol-resistance regulon repressor
MTRFRVSDDGRLMDETDSHAVKVLKEELPWADGLAVDTYLALSKGYWSLWSMFSAYCGEFELSVPRFNLLWLLYNTRGHPLSMTELGSLLNVSTANVTKHVASLERDGWAVRVTQDSDRRVVYGQLTPEGEERFRSIRTTLFKRMENVTRGLTTDEQLMLCHLLTKLRLGHMADFAHQDDAEAPRKARAR